MERKNKMRAAALLMAVLMAFSAITVSAAGSLYSDEIGTADNVLKTVSIDKYLVMDTDATVPNADFTFTVTAGEASGTTIVAGVDANLVTVTGDGLSTITGTEANDYKLSFTTSDNNAAASAGYGGSGTFNSTNQKFVKKIMTVNFSNCKFTEPGIYRYKLTESGANQGITNDTNTDRLIDVYVEDASTDTVKKLNIAGYAFYTSTGTNASKSTSYTNTYDTSNLTFYKEVSGNQASRDKYFAFTVTIDNAVYGTTYQVDITSGADTTIKDNTATKTDYQGKTNSSDALVATTQSTAHSGTYCVTATYYLQHGQYITIKGLANGNTYTVNEDYEDYSSKGAKAEGYTSPTSGSIGDTDVKTSYTNTREGTIPTGIILTIAPFAAAVLIGGAGLIVILVKKRKAREN